MNEEEIHKKLKEYDKAYRKKNKEKLKPKEEKKKNG